MHRTLKELQKVDINLLKEIIENSKKPRPKNKDNPSPESPEISIPIDLLKVLNKLQKDVENIPGPLWDSKNDTNDIITLREEIKEESNKTSKKIKDHKDKLSTLRQLRIKLVEAVENKLNIESQIALLDTAFKTTKNHKILNTGLINEYQEKIELIKKVLESQSLNNDVKKKYTASLDILELVIAKSTQLAAQKNYVKETKDDLMQKHLENIASKVNHVNPEEKTTINSAKKAFIEFNSFLKNNYSKTERQALSEKIYSNNTLASNEFLNNFAAFKKSVSGNRFKIISANLKNSINDFEKILGKERVAIASIKLELGYIQSSFKNKAAREDVGEILNRIENYGSSYCKKGGLKDEGLELETDLKEIKSHNSRGSLGIFHQSNTINNCINTILSLIKTLPAIKNEKMKDIELKSVTEFSKKSWK